MFEDRDKLPCHVLSGQALPVNGKLRQNGDQRGAEERPGEQNLSGKRGQASGGLESVWDV